jgi:SAM-dependent methyltransferase
MIGHSRGNHRKVWEHVFILRALMQAGKLMPRSRGLGFGCGTESLPSFFASKGCQILATDLSPDSKAASDWQTTNQHAANVEALWHDLCERTAFDQNVSFRHVDMNDIPSDLRDFDFTWSSCALEHLGSIRHGLNFIKNSVRCLKPGGVAVHTTELNLSSNDLTVDDLDLVLFRRQDIEDFIDECRAEGIAIAPPNWRCVSCNQDLMVDRFPYERTTHLRVFLRGFISTSFRLIATRVR